MEFDFKKYKGKYAMHCKTEKEADDFCGAMQRNGMKWMSGVPYSISTNYHVYRPDTCYSFNEGEYCHKSFYDNIHYKILEWSDYMEFTKDDLKVGYVVQFRNGTLSMLTETTIGKEFSGGLKLDNYQDNLMMINYKKQYDIIKVYGFTVWTSKFGEISKDSRELLWERKEPIELTMQEIADKFGISVDDLKIRK